MLYYSSPAPHADMDPRVKPGDDGGRGQISPASGEDGEAYIFFGMRPAR